jgi:hypothetical protein
MPAGRRYVLDVIGRRGVGFGVSEKRFKAKDGTKSPVFLPGFDWINWRFTRDNRHRQRDREIVDEIDVPASGLRRIKQLGRHFENLLTKTDQFGLADVLRKQCEADTVV